MNYFGNVKASALEIHYLVIPIYQMLAQPLLRVSIIQKLANIFLDEFVALL